MRVAAPARSWVVSAAVLYHRKAIHLQGLANQRCLFLTGELDPLINRAIVAPDALQRVNSSMTDTRADERPAQSQTTGSRVQ